MSTSGITLSSGIRRNLYALQTTAKLTEVSQKRLSTGKRVNSAIDDPINFFASTGHLQRAADLDFRKDSMQEAIQTIKAANNGIEAITTLVGHAKSLTQSALASNSGTDRDALAAQFDEILGQMDLVADDAGYRGINLLKGSDQTLHVYFDQEAESRLTLTGFDATNSGLGIKTVAENSDTGGTGQDTSIVMQGAYVRTAVSSDGTLGYGENTAPGIQHDPTGTGTFGVADYLTPGSPWEVFAVESDETGLLANNNSGTDAMSSSGVTDLSATSVYDHHLRWEGYVTDAFQISTDYFFNDGDERIEMRTTISAASDLTGLKFLRAIDPDPDSYDPYNSSDTTNTRGFDANNDGDFNDSGDIAPENWVNSQGAVTGLTLGLYSDSPYAHNTGISSSWSDQPSDYLAGTDGGDGDSTIGMGFDLGNLAAGESVSIAYSYVMAGSIDQAETAQASGRWSSNLDLSKADDQLDTALTTLRTQSKLLTTNLSIITQRLDFTQAMVNTLQDGAADLINADMNEEGANMLMLQIRQQLGSTSLQLASQQTQSVLKLF